MVKNFILPQVCVALTSGTVTPVTDAVFNLGSDPEHYLLLVLGGRAPGREWLRELHDHCGCDRVWAIDSGTDACRMAGIIPERVIGDLDSISSDSRKWAIENQILSNSDIYPTEKDDTDFQLALKLSRKLNTRDNTCEPNNFDFIVTGCWGGRYDHAFYNILVARQAYTQSQEQSHDKQHQARYHDPDPQVLCMADDREILVFLNATQAPASVTIHFIKTPVAISLLPLTDKATGVTVTGVRWALTDATLPDWNVAALSNRILDISNPDPEHEHERENHEVTVSLKTGTLGVYAAFQA